MSYIDSVRSEDWLKTQEYDFKLAVSKATHKMVLSGGEFQFPRTTELGKDYVIVANNGVEQMLLHAGGDWSIVLGEERSSIGKPDVRILLKEFAYTMKRDSFADKLPQGLENPTDDNTLLFANEVDSFLTEYVNLNFVELLAEFTQSIESTISR